MFVVLQAASSADDGSWARFISLLENADGLLKNRAMFTTGVEVGALITALNELDQFRTNLRESIRNSPDMPMSRLKLIPASSGLQRWWELDSFCDDPLYPSSSLEPWIECDIDAMRHCWCRLQG